MSTPVITEPVLQLHKAEVAFLEFVKVHFDGQKRKYTFEPFYYHPMRVAATVQAHEPDRAVIMAAIGHDLIEDTKCSREELSRFLRSLFDSSEADFIYSWTLELTNHFTKESYPFSSRKERKLMEAKRLHMVSAIGQNIKCADIIDNVPSIKLYEPEFAKIYCAEKAEVLKGFTKANRALLHKALKVIQIP